MSSPSPAQPTANDASNEPEADFDVDAEMADTQNPAAATANGASSNVEPEFPNQDNQHTTTAPHHNRKDATLREFLSKMDDYAPIIPDAVTAHYLTLAGLPPPSPSDPTGTNTNTTPLPLARLLALATQKFIADVAADAYQYSRTRTGNSASANVSGAGPGQPGAAGVVGAAAGKGGPQQAHLGVQRSGFGGGGQGGSGQGKTVLTMEDLGMAVQEYGINVKRGEFYR